VGCCGKIRDAVADAGGGSGRGPPEREGGGRGVSAILFEKAVTASLVFFFFNYFYKMKNSNFYF
jgi:hypothetical protein